MLLVLRVSLLYFCIVFAVGFALGTVRVLLLVDLLGERYAELAEMPLMILACGVTAHYLVAKYHAQLSAVRVVWVGLVSLVLLLAVEFSVVLALRGLSITEYFASRDPVSGTAYIVGLVSYAVAPVVIYIARLRSRT